jgi:hypothetical protein
VAGLVSVVLLVVAAGCAASSVSHSPLPSPAPATHSENGQWTGLQWREVTRTEGDFFSHRAPPVAVPMPGYDPAEIVVWNGGVAMIGGDDRSVWTSKDGLSWLPSPGSPNYAGLVSWNGMLLAGGFVNDRPGLWTSTDASAWQQAPIRFDVYGCQQAGVCLGLATGRKGILAVTTEGRLGLMDPGTPYLSTDGVTWTPYPLPEDANSVAVHSFFGGFLATGSVPVPGQAAGAMVPRVWLSSDGIHWSVYRAVRPGGTTNDQWPYWGLMDPWPIVEGPRGAYSCWMSSPDGTTWREDYGVPYDQQALSDGARIIVAQTWLARFYLTEGDGNWFELEQGGDIGQLPAGGRAYLLPNGLLWVAGERVFFGEALSGVHPSGSLVPWTPSPTPWPGPS